MILKLAKKGLVFLTPLAATVGVMVYAQAHSPVQQDPEFVPGPSEWVPFSADSRLVFPSGETVVGRYHRASDGSTRTQTGLTRDKVTRIGIKNMRDRLLFLWDEARGWTSQPMELPALGWLPPPRRYLTRTMTFPGGVLEGFEVIHKNGGRVQEFEAPQLNFFSLVILMECDQPRRCGFWYSNIQVGEQSPELFTIPEDASFTQLSEPGGIITRDPLPELP